MRLESLRSNFLSLPWDEQLNLIRAIRADRRIRKQAAVKESVATEKAASVKRTKATKSFDALLSGVAAMDETQIAALLAKLGG